MTRREHRRLSHAVDAWVDHELDSAAVGPIADHVRECWDCSATAETTRLLKRALRDRRDREPPGLAVARLRRFARQLTEQ